MPINHLLLGELHIISLVLYSALYNFEHLIVELYMHSLKEAEVVTQSKYENRR